MSAGKFEAIKYALRQNKDWTVVSFVVHPNDCSSELNNLPIGARVEIEWTECTDEEPKEIAPVAQLAERRAASAEVAGSKPAGCSTPKERRPFAELPLSQQCAIRCMDADFRSWVRSRLPSREQSLFDEDTIAGVRRYLGVSSRAQLDTNENRAALWRWVNSQYEQHVTEKQHGALVR